MLAFIASLAIAGAPETGTDFCTVNLVSSVRSYAPGKPFYVGLRFQMKPGWHVYWRNPGDSGQEIRVKWSLPKGWKVGELYWPEPKVLVDAGIVNYGYEKEVVLAARLTTTWAALRNPGSATRIRADLDWLVCDRERCLPAKLRLDLNVHSSKVATPDPSTSKELDGVVREQPSRRSATADAALAGKEIVLKIMALSGDGERIASVRFFPYDPTLIANEVEQKVDGNGKWITLHLRTSDAFDKKIRRVRGELAIHYSSGSLHNSLLYVDVPLRRPTGGKP